MIYLVTNFQHRCAHATLLRLQPYPSLMSFSLQAVDWEELGEVVQTSTTVTPVDKTDKTVTEEIETNARLRDVGPGQERSGAGSPGPDLGTETESGKGLEDPGRGIGRGRGRGPETETANGRAEAGPRVLATEIANAAAVKTVAGENLTRSRTSLRKKWTSTNTDISRSSRKKLTVNQGSSTAALPVTMIIEFLLH